MAVLQAERDRNGSDAKQSSAQRAAKPTSHARCVEDDPYGSIDVFPILVESGPMVFNDELGRFCTGASSDASRRP